MASMVGAGGRGSHLILAACGGYHSNSVELGFRSVDGLAGWMDRSPTLAAKTFVGRCLAQGTGGRAGGCAAAGDRIAAGVGKGWTARSRVFGFLLLPVREAAGAHPFVGGARWIRGMAVWEVEWEINSIGENHSSFINHKLIDIA